MLHFDYMHHRTEIEVDPTTMPELANIARRLKLDYFKLTVTSWKDQYQTPTIAIGVDKFSVEHKKYVGGVFVQMERRECDPHPSSSEMLRLNAESQLWTMSKACPTVAYRFVSDDCKKKRMSARLKKIALANLHLDQSMAGIKVAMKALGFSDQSPTFAWTQCGRHGHEPRRC